MGFADVTNDLLNQIQNNKEKEYQDKYGYNPWGFPGAPPAYVNPYDPKSMSLVSQMGDKINGLQTDKSGINAYRAEALRKGPSTWAGLANAQQDMMAKNARSSASSSAANQAAGARSSLAMRGGLDSGARERIAQSSSKNLLDMNQKINQDVAGNKMQIGMNDEQNRISQLGALPGLENTALQPDLERTKLLGNAYQIDNSNQFAANQGLNQYNQNKYATQMAGWAAGQQANATRNSGGGGCCFIFLEARYGNGVMDRVVRKYRDEHMTDKNRRGYYKVAEVLVPLMRKSKVVKTLVRLTMTDPMVAYGKAFYGEGTKLGLVFKPVAKFWIGLFDYMGGDHPFIRENGEVV